MKTQTQMKLMAGTLAALVGAAAASVLADEPTAKPTEQAPQGGQAKDAMVRDAEATLASFQQADPGLSKFMSGAVGYAIFPSVGKGAVGVGGAYGKGVLFEHGKATGSTSLTQVTVGAQLGGQSYSEIVFLESEQAVANFKKGQLAMAAQVSAVAVHEGASANARYAHGVAVFTLAKAGLMAEASVGGQKFAYKPFAM
jgi:lipid-binding SYLF domain-containing protein